MDNKSKVKGRKTKAAPRDKPTKPLRSGDSQRFRRCGLLNLLLNLGIVGLIWATILAIPSLAWRVQRTAQMRAGDDALDSTFRIENAGPFTLYRVNYGCVYEMVKGDFGTLQNTTITGSFVTGSLRTELQPTDWIDFACPGPGFTLQKPRNTKFASLDMVFTFTPKFWPYREFKCAHFDTVPNSSGQLEWRGSPVDACRKLAFLIAK